MTTLQNARMAHRDSHRQPTNLPAMKNQAASAQELKIQFGHTPGPWVVEDSGTMPYRVTTDHDQPREQYEYLVAYFPMVYPDKMKSRERRANARLIAAAPALLQALRSMLHSVDTAQEISIEQAIQAHLAIQSATL